MDYGLWTGLWTMDWTVDWAFTLQLGVQNFSTSEQSPVSLSEEDVEMNVVLRTGVTIFSIGKTSLNTTVA